MVGAPVGERSALAAHADAARIRHEQSLISLQQSPRPKSLSDGCPTNAWVDAILVGARSHGACRGNGKNAAATPSQRNHEPTFEPVRDAIDLLVKRRLNLVSRIENSGERAAGARVVHAYRLESVRPN